jgi:hypothetical protein
VEEHCQKRQKQITGKRTAAMRTIITLALLSVAAITAKAQDNPDAATEVHTLAQMMRVQATISPAWSVTLLSGNDTVQSVSSGRTNVYLHGTAEYYWDERFSTRGDIYFLINPNDAKPGGVKYNHGLQVGVSCHLIKGSNIDPFIGIRTGLNLTQITPVTLNDGVAQAPDYHVPKHIDPTWAPVIGCNFYGERIFHFFVEGAWMQGTYRPAIGPQLSLEEFRISAGLGFNISFFKPVDTVRQKI